jgi:hypothetical protein
VVARVIRGRAVGQVSKTELALQRLEGVEELLFAMEAAVRVVPRVVIELYLAGRHLEQPGTQRSGKSPSLLLLRLGISG